MLSTSLLPRSSGNAVLLGKSDYKRMRFLRILMLSEIAIP